jgi:hypothetical protein
VLHFAQKGCGLSEVRFLTRSRVPAIVLRRGAILTPDEVRDLVERMLWTSGRRVDLSKPSE